jgi:citrate lyase subunit beta / citryl-CoA lyase
MTRSWLFAPGHNQKLLDKVFTVGADEVILDLEDAVPQDLKDRAREMVREVLVSQRAWVRVNKPRTEMCERDLNAVAEMAAGIRIPKVESAEEVAWVRTRAPGPPLTATIESALGLVRSLEIAACEGVANLAYGGADLAVDLGIDEAGEEETLYARSHLVIASRAAGIEAPSDGVYTQLNDDKGLRRSAQRAKRLGFGGKSAIHPRQVPIINDVFTPSDVDRDWARRVLAAFQASGGAATKMEDGTFVDTAVAERARRITSSER